MIYHSLVLAAVLTLAIAIVVIVGTPEHPCVRTSVKVFAYSGAVSVTSVMLVTLAYSLILFHSI